MYANWLDINTLKRRHRYYSRSGFYFFLAKNAIKVAAVLLLLILAFLALEKWVIDLDVLFHSLFKNMSNGMVFMLFTLSESLFGLIPPDFFIIWARKFLNPWVVVTVLAILSYTGGLVSYHIGYQIRSIKKLNDFLSEKFQYHFSKVRRWGAIFIIVSALFPLPYSTICMVSGVLKFPVKVFLLLGIARIIRFYAYALVLFGIIN
jgi:membrane protein YqaA with SNARE-associated domain